MSELDQYWQKGGTYVIPVEVINQLTGEFEDKDKEIERLNNDIKYWEEKYSHTKFDENRYKDRCEKLLEKLNFYENTEWGIRSCEILKIFKNILKGEDKE